MESGLIPILSIKKRMMKEMSKRINDLCGMFIISYYDMTELYFMIYIRWQIFSLNLFLF